MNVYTLAECLNQIQKRIKWCRCKHCGEYVTTGMSKRRVYCSRECNIAQNRTTKMVKKRIDNYKSYSDYLNNGRRG